MAEVFKEKVYDRYFSGKKDLTVLDVGGNIGITSYYFSQFSKVVYTLEPSLEHYATLCHQLDFNRLANVFPFKLALSNENGEAQFHHLPNKTMYSLRPAGIDPKQGFEIVHTVRLDTFLQDRECDHVDFMKLDCEGSEADIICGDGFQNAAPKIDTLFLEVHSWNGRHPNQLKDGLKMAGFKNIQTISNDATLWICTK